MEAVRYDHSIAEREPRSVTTEMWASTKSCSSSMGCPRGLASSSPMEHASITSLSTTSSELTVCVMHRVGCVLFTMWWFWFMKGGKPARVQA
eukprot:1158067-Pelagomonas_calceolata.AAC.13